MTEVTRMRRQCFKVRVLFSESAKETMEEKILRIVRNSGDHFEDLTKNALTTRASGKWRVIQLSKTRVGKNVETIGKNAFKNCKKLKKITVKSKVLKKVGSGALKKIHKKAVVKVPKKKLKAYKKLFKKKGQAKTVKIKK